MHLHILGVCGTFMAGVAALAREAGHRVTGSDAAAYPPMSTQLEQLGIQVLSGYSPAHLEPRPDVIVVGNVVTRGNPEMEHALDAGMPYLSGPQWLAENILRGRHVLAVAGTHGKTTTSAILAWLLDQAGLKPGFLIGGVPQNFGVSARLGAGKYFVVEADEYDTAFFDKRSKFVHYGPRTCILNNLEYDHADIFPDLASIERQFHHLVRTVPKSGRLIVNGADEALARVLKVGCWSEVEKFNDAEGWSAELEPSLPPPHASSPLPLREGAGGGGTLRVRRNGDVVGVGATPLAGIFNAHNVVAAIAAAAHVGVTVEQSLKALASFRSVKRRLEVVGEVNGVRIYDDFAHHPTAVAATLSAVRGTGPGRILAVLEPRSNTMRLGPHAGDLVSSLRDAEHTFLYARADLRWDARAELAGLGERLHVHDKLDALVADVAAAARPADRVVVMSNGDFGGVHRKLLAALTGR